MIPSSAASAWQHEGRRSGPAPWKLGADALCLAPAAGACAPGCAGDRGGRSWP